MGSKQKNLRETLALVETEGCLDYEVEQLPGTTLCKLTMRHEGRSRFLFFSLNMNGSDRRALLNRRRDIRRLWRELEEGTSPCETS